MSDGAFGSVGAVLVPRLRTRRLALEPIAMAHSAGMFALWSSPEVCRYAGPIFDMYGRRVLSPVPTVSESDKIVAFWLDAAVQGWGCRWALLLLASDTFIGTVGFNSLGACSEYAYHLIPDHWGQGFMPEATDPVFDWAVAERSCREIEAFFDAENQRSLSFVERQRFVRSGVTNDGTIRYTKTLSE